MWIGKGAGSRRGNLEMSKLSKGRGLAAALALLTIGSALSCWVATGFAGESNPSADQIVRALMPVEEPPTRGLSMGPQTQTESATATEQGFIKALRGRSPRQLTPVEREEIATMAKDKPNIDLEINFDYNSANVSAKSLAAVQALGKALSNPELKGSTFIVAGHTDGIGSEAYNQNLSERRADSIKRHLVKFGVAASDLVTVGYGKSKLKNAADPRAEINRRVQVVNMANKTTASK
jgi:outer membrane protein OmpA-like peptidoglycan-associated protein